MIRSTGYCGGRLPSGHRPDQSFLYCFRGVTKEQFNPFDIGIRHREVTNGLHLMVVYRRHFLLLSPLLLKGK